MSARGPPLDPCPIHFFADGPGAASRGSRDSSTAARPTLSPQPIRNTPAPARDSGRPADGRRGEPRAPPLAARPDSTEPSPSAALTTPSIDRCRRPRRTLPRGQRVAVDGGPRRRLRVMSRIWRIDATDSLLTARAAAACAEWAAERSWKAIEGPRQSARRGPAASRPPAISAHSFPDHGSMNRAEIGSRAPQTWNPARAIVGPALVHP